MLLFKEWHKVNKSNWNMFLYIASTGIFLRLILDLTIKRSVVFFVSDKLLDNLDFFINPMNLISKIVEY